MSPLEIQMDTMVNDPLRPNLSSRLTQQDLINNGLMAIGMAPMGITKAKTAYELAHDVASKNAEKMLGLPKGNTAMQRARALGIETSPSKRLYHSTRDAWDKSTVIDPSKSDLGFHVGTIEQAEQRAKAFGTGGVNFPEGANIMPLVKSKYANFLKVADDGSFHADAIAPQLEKKGLLAKGKGKQIAKEIDKDWALRKQYDQQMRDVLEQQSYDGVKYSNAQEGPGLSYAVTNPSILRSIFAAFDPARVNESDLLAGLAPYLGVGGLLSLGLITPEEAQAK